MDTRTGRIYRNLELVPAEDREYVKQMVVAPTARQLKLGKVHRNDPCPCGSGKKFKQCCMRQEASR